MFIVDQFWLAFLLCLLGMLCWGSWANTKKLPASKALSFQLFYWDYGIGMLLFSIIIAFTFGSIGSHGRSFLTDLLQAKYSNLCFAFLGGIIFNLGNVLFIAGVELVGMSMAFSVGIGLGLVLGVIINYIAQPLGNIPLLAAGVILICFAMVLAANAYKRLHLSFKYPIQKSMIVLIICGILMGVFYRFIAVSLSTQQVFPEPGKLTPYTAMVLFAAGVFISNFIFNSYLMKKPIVGKSLAFSTYFHQRFISHLPGWLGGAIWEIGGICNFLATTKAGFAISFGLGQGSAMIGMIWGVFVWKDFANGPAGTSWRISLMFAFYLIGLIALVLARLI
jgi:glucose uptake protein